MIRLLLCLVLLQSQLKADDKLVDHPTIKAMCVANNKIRKEKTLANHTLLEELTKAAQDHAWYMARMHSNGDEDFNHRGGNGNPGIRASRYAFQGTVKENIARGYNTIDDTFKAWLTSDSHKEAICSDTEMVGFGYAIASDGTTYWVAVYGKPKISNPLPIASR